MFADELKHYLDAGYPLLWVPSHEEQRVEAEMRRLAEGMKRHRLFVIAATTGSTVAWESLN